ncbi:DNA (cytosine-5)-methyltransferase 1 [Paenibacillus jamilae]|jgi:DNA (cytosine-5)-methyltransferase 1|uniref:DNA cytosine methyltransferase n=1 Tax=Paenibacillus polymyxa TaxID=1406 RepID=UPI001580C86F|nr:DNA cytosine methyltransferase [Paenibacillus polymyxa]MDP9674859.1 DNA (cytosine-5)-methyltransferase 1 [Paenibacillus jamilae]MBY0023775.1 DNA cytosine methyltransferase [Paenibacillus polymyxa]MBY0056447.1 DNA cytosine methyltransferase [Paenibacillus polymyxa]MBY0071794.1 DNA cytosine methyltransferase [Paenibacillus polymyxa]MBY0080640.1 DNA cytosine methyltransferase [Paenibacillus polymyxa]
MIANHTPNPQDGRYSSRYLSRKRVANWDEAAYTVLASARDVSLHPGERKGTVSIRNYNVTPQLPSNGLTVAELFCGGGLMAVGLKSAGYTLTFANDFDKRAVQAYAHNIGDHVVYGDITSDDIQAQIPDADIIAGGPPCQDYSVAGSGAGEEGERGKLVWTYLGVIARKQPKAFVFENVKGLVSKKHRPTFDALLAYFESINYSVSWRVINAWDYGVAQKRERVIAVGIRKDLGFTFEFPEPRAEDYRTQVLRDVIGDLPEPSANHEKKLISEKALQGYARRNAGGAFGFRVNKWEEPSPTIMGRIFNEGKAFVHPSYADNHDGHLFDNVNPDWTYEKANRQASWETPGATVGGHARNEGVHPESKPQPRRFTVRECLRIQSVPDWYVLPADISLSAQYRIVGNGVASRVSYLIGVALAEQLNAVLARDLQEAA